MSFSEFDSLFKSKAEYLLGEDKSLGSNLAAGIYGMKIHLKSNTYNKIQYYYSLKEFQKDQLPSP